VQPLTAGSCRFAHHLFDFILEAQSMNAMQPILLAVSTVILTAGELDQATRKVLLDHLQKSSTYFQNEVKGLTAEQWNFKPAPDVWSIAECAEHIALSEDFLRDMVEKKVLAAPASPERIAERKVQDDKILKMITDRSFKAKAPEVLQAGKQPIAPESMLQKFREGREKTIALATTRDDLREHAGPHFVLKELDGYQWLLYLSGHTVRHTEQIREIKSNPGFPKNK
jgi:hypothetical protein